MKKHTLIKKTFTAIVLSMAVVIGAQAQERENMNTLFGNKNGHIDHGGWAGLNFGYTRISDMDTYLMGARGGWLINHRFTVGLAGNGFISDKEIYDVIPDKTLNLGGGYGGLFLEAIVFPYSPVHVTVPVIIGAGGVAYTSNHWRSDDHSYGDYTYDSDAYFVIEPGLEVELNLVKFMRFALGGSYRYTSNVNLINSDSDMLRGFNGHFALKFGWF